MRRAELLFERPDGLEATAPPEAEGRGRDDVRLLVSTQEGHSDMAFADLPCLLGPGDLLVVNDSGTLPASLPAKGGDGGFRLNAAVRFGRRTWLVEPRRGASEPGPLPIRPGSRARVCGEDVRFVSPYPGSERLWFVQGDLSGPMARCGEPIRYGYLAAPQPLSAYQTIFAAAAGSAEMPSAARPFTAALVEELGRRGVGVAAVTLHTGVSSIEVSADDVEAHPVPPEPFRVGAETADAVNAARSAGGRVVAVGTTVVRALESAWAGPSARAGRPGKVEAASGFTRVVVTPERGVCAVDGLLTGFHDPGASHLAMLHAIAGRGLVQAAYDRAVTGGYRWHEFGDSHLILPGHRGAP